MIRDEYASHAGKVSSSPSVRRGSLQIVSTSCGAATAFLGFLGLLAWVSGQLALARLLSRYIPMAAPTGIALVLLGAIVLVHARRPWRGWGAVVAGAVAAVVAAFGLFELLESLLGAGHVLEADLARLVAAHSPEANRMSPATAAILLPAGTGILFLAFQAKWPARPLWGHLAGILGTTVIVLATAFLASYLYRTPLMYEGSQIPMAITTAAALVFLGVAVVAAAGAGAAPLRFLAGPSTRARLFRAFLPLTVAAVLTSDMLHRLPSPLAGLNPALLSAVSATVFAVLAGLAVFAVSRSMGRALDHAHARRERVETALKESEARYRMLLENAPVALGVSTRAGLPLTWNDTMAGLLGYTHEELSRLNVANTYRDPSDRERILHALGEQGSVRDFEVQLKRKDGTFFWGSVTVTPVAWEGAEATLTALLDVTERKRAEKSLRDSVELLETLIDTIPDPVFYKDARGVYLGCNEAYARMVAGRPKEEIIGRTIREVRGGISPEQAEETVRMDEGLLKRAGVRRYEVRRRSPVGEEKDYLATQATFRDASGKVAGLVGVMLDITDRKQVEAALQSEHAQAQQYLDIVGVLMVALDAEGRITLVNRQACEVLGYEEKELLGRDWFDVCLPPAVREDIRAVFAKLTADDGELVEYHENPVLTKSGAQRLVAFHNTEIRDAASKVVGVLFSGEDITERREAETERASLEEQLRQSQKMEAVGRLAGGIAHDFNNKLCVVIGYSEMLLRKMAPADPLREAAEQIHLAGRSAADLTRQLLIYSRKQAPEPKVLDLNVVLSRMEGQFTRLIGEDIRVRFRPAPCLGGVLIDPTYVEQVVLNLVVNARDAMPKGGELVIETADVDLDESYALHHPGMSAGPHVMLSVGDTGVGMDRDTLSHLFEPFFTTKEVGRGTGLGLSTVYGIVQQAKGGIDVSSQPGQGSTFRVYLPRVWAPAEASAIAFAPGDLPPGRERILVVEDDDKVRGLVVRILRQCGYEVLEAASPGHGAILAGDYSGSIDLLLADVVMPEMSGPELAEHIDAAGRGMEVVFISGHARDMLDKHKLDDQNFVLLQKPFSPEALAQVVRRALDKKAARR